MKWVVGLGFYQNGFPLDDQVASIVNPPTGLPGRNWGLNGASNILWDSNCAMENEHFGGVNTPKN